jgi:uncharacterized protein
MTEFWNNPDFVALTGSRLYGTNNPDSDSDYRGFVVPPTEYLIGLPVVNFEQKEFEGEDKVIYGIRNFFMHLLRGNTNLLESLFSTKVGLTYRGMMVLENRKLFISKQFYRSIRGFAFCELRKAKGVKLEINRENNTYAETIDNLCTVFQLKRFERDSIIDIIEDGRPDLKLKMEIPHHNRLGDKRKKSIAEHGFSVKNAYHTIRLLGEGIELMQTGHLTFPRPNAAYLKDIRNGNVPIEEIVKQFEVLDAELKEACDRSNLPDRADISKVNDLYMQIVKTRL